jgi:uncharacterized repeat protein (TIGR01451 family)
VCSTYGYLYQTPNADTHQIFQVDLVSGETTQIGTTADNVNAVGYNPTDDYMYGSDATTGNLVQVASDGTLTPLPDPAGLTWESFNVGDFDADGHYWVTRSLDNAAWYEIDYAAGSPTFGQVLSSGTISGATTGSDWVYVDGGLYSITNGTNHLVKFDTTTHTSTDLGAIEGVTASTVGFGAGYADAAGNLYYSDNNTGVIYRVNPNTVTGIELSSGPPSGGNDGVRCATAPIPTVTVTKTVDGRAADADQFTVGLDNAAGDTLTDATTAGTGTTTSTTDWPVSQGSTYTITDEMAAGSPDTLAAYAASVVCTDPAGNTFTTGGSKGAWTFTIPGSAAYTCNVTNAAPTFNVTKTASTTAVNPGETVDYTVTVTNTSESDFTASNPASFTDDLSNVLDDATYNDDAEAGAGTVSYTAPTLSWSGPLAAGASTTVTYSATVNDPDTGDKTLTNAVVPGRGGSCDPADGCTTDTGSRSYTVEKAASTATAKAGDTVTYTVTVTNTGQAAYTDAVPATFDDDLSKVLDDATYNDDVTAGGTVTGNTLSWAGAIPVGGSTTVTYSVTVNNPDTGDRELTNAVVPTTPGGTCTTEGGCTTNTLVGDPSYTVAKTASTDAAKPGQTVKYTIVVKNTGTEDYTTTRPASFTDDLSKVLDDAKYNDDASEGATVDGSTLSWSGPLKAGATITVTYSVTVDNPDTGDRKLVNAVVPTDPTGSCTTEGGCTTNTIVADPSYTVAKAASTTSVKPGQSVTYTVTVHNTGAVDYTTDVPASFTDDLSAVLDDATYNGDATNGATVKGSTLSWSGPLKAGATTKVTYSVTVNDPNTGDLKLRNVVDPGDGTGICDPDASCVTNTTVTPLTVVPSAPPAGPSVATGGTVLSPAPVWPWIGSGAIALAGMVTLGMMTLRRRGQNLGD